MRISRFDVFVIWLCVSIAYFNLDNPNVMKHIMMFVVAFVASNVISGIMSAKSKKDQDKID